MNFIYEGEHEERIDRILSQRLDGLSREQIKTLIKKGNLKLNGRKVNKPSTRVKRGTSCEVVIEDFSDKDLPAPARILFDIIFEDEDIILIDKPRGLVVHPAKGHKDDTIVSGLLYLKKKLSDIEVFRPGIVHRLDMGTSGLLIIAKNNPAHRALSEQFRARKVSKTYYAVCDGVPSHFTGTIDVPLSKNVHNMKIIPDVHGKKSVTEFAVKSNTDHNSFIQLKPSTGRTHQLRAHLKFIGCPIAGDTLYGGSAHKLFNENGFALHAGGISFIHPTSREIMSFKSPLPDDIMELKGILGL